MQVRELLEAALPILEEANRYTANNIANVDTPGYVPTQVDFKASLAAALAGRKSGVSVERTHPRHIASRLESRHLVVEPSQLAAPRNDGNRVNLDYELTQLARNKHTMLADLLKNQTRLMRDVLRAR